MKIIACNSNLPLAEAVFSRLNTDLAVIDKRRQRAGVSDVMNVEGPYCIVVDDIADSGGSLCNAAQALMERGGAAVEAYVTHGVLTGNAVERVGASPLKTAVMTDSIAATAQVVAADNIRQISTANLLSRGMRAINDESSVSSLFH